MQKTFEDYCNSPAFPVAVGASYLSSQDISTKAIFDYDPGLTKLEYYTGRFMQSFMGREDSERTTYIYVARGAVRAATEMLRALYDREYPGKREGVQWESIK